MLEPLNANPKLEKQIRESIGEEIGKHSKNRHSVTMRADWLETPLGTMLAIADDDSLHLLSFLETAATERKVALIQSRLDADLVMAANPVIERIKNELEGYFAGGLREFRSPIKLMGTDFQINVWEQIRRIPYGHSLSYAEAAARLGKPAAFRAVAQAVGQNPFHILVPVHRIVNSDGGLGSNAAVSDRKKWLLDFEKEKNRHD